MLLLSPIVVVAQNAEPQTSFAQESKSHEYYVKQAGLWWAEVEGDKHNEKKWYNYYRACRNAQGTANWREDFVKESPSLRLGDDIVKLMEQYIPNTFTHYFAAGSTGGVSPNGAAYLVKAYAIDPNFEGINSDMVTYAQTVSDMELRKKVNKFWFTKNEIQAGYINYGYNVLMSVAAKGVLLTQSDNDTYSLWMLQDALNIRPDVTVINIDFLILDAYRERIFKQLNLPPIDLTSHSINNYGLNWETIVKHILSKYNNNRPLHLALTLTPGLYSGFSNRLSLYGLTKKLTNKHITAAAENKNLVTTTFHLDYLTVQTTADKDPGAVNSLNLNYIDSFKIAFNNIKKTNRPAAEKIKQLALNVAQKSADQSVINSTALMFR